MKIKVSLKLSWLNLTNPSFFYFLHTFLNQNTKNFLGNFMEELNSTIDLDIFQNDEFKIFYRLLCLDLEKGLDSLYFFSHYAIKLLIALASLTSFFERPVSKEECKFLMLNENALFIGCFMLTIMTNISRYGYSVKT